MQVFSAFLSHINTDQNGQEKTLVQKELSQMICFAGGAL